MNELKLQESVLRAGPRLILGMLYKLSVHAAKGPWDQKSIEDLMIGLDEEVSELKVAIREKQDYSAILDECADVANYCLMIADHAARGRKLGPGPMEQMLRENQPIGPHERRCHYISRAGTQCIREMCHGDGHAFPERA
jgi:hypothetical protein